MNKFWSFYDNGTGMLHTSRIAAPPGTDLAGVTPSGHTAIEGWYDRESQKVDWEADPPVIVDYQPNGPADTDDYTYAWDSGTKRWKATKTLAKEKKDKKEEVRAARVVDEFSTFTWDGHTFDGDATSQSRITGASLLALQAQLASAPFSIDWTLADDSVVTLDAPDMLAVGAALATYVQSMHTQFRSIKDEIEAASDVPTVHGKHWIKP